MGAAVVEVAAANVYGSLRDDGACDTYGDA